MRGWTDEEVAAVTLAAEQCGDSARKLCSLARDHGFTRDAGAIYSRMADKTKGTVIRTALGDRLETVRQRLYSIARRKRAEKSESDDVAVAAVAEPETDVVGGAPTGDKSLLARKIRHVAAGVGLRLYDKATALDMILRLVGK